MLMRPQAMKLSVRNAAASSSKKKMHTQVLALRLPCKYCNKFAEFVIDDSVNVIVLIY